MKHRDLLCTIVGVKTHTLLDRDGRPHQTHARGTLGGHRRSTIYGRVDCPSALRWIARAQYVQHRVFFADEDVDVAAGYRPCGRWRPGVGGSRLVGMDSDQLLASPDPAVSYRAHRRLAGAAEEAPDPTREELP